MAIWYRSRWFAWWYAAIGLGFVLLGLRWFLAGFVAGALLRWAVAAGFFALALFQFSFSRTK